MRLSNHLNPISNRSFGPRPTAAFGMRYMSSLSAYSKSITADGRNVSASSVRDSSTQRESVVRESVNWYAPAM